MDTPDLVARAAALDADTAEAYPGDHDIRQPLHTVYVAAHRIVPGIVREWGDEALRLLHTHGSGDGFVAAMGMRDAADTLVDAVRARVAAKLVREPVEDLRVDFEDGYGTHEDVEEDRDAGRAAAMFADQRPPRWGLRVKPMCDGMAARGLRTLDVFLTGVLDAADGVLPDGFVVTLPKVLGPGYVAVFADALSRLESQVGLTAGTLRFEIQVETTQSVIGTDGRVALRALVDAAAGRCAAAHFGTFDYTAALGLLPRDQRITHPACDVARYVMQAALAGTGVQVSDGSTNVVPASDDSVHVHAAWRTHATAVRHALASGLFQGWDLHPAQLVSRYGAFYAYLLQDIDTALSRVAAWREGMPGPGGVLDEPATVRALERQIRMARDHGALEAEDAR